MNGIVRETHLRKGRQTVKLGLIKVVRDLFPEEELKTAYSLLDGVFCNLAGSVLSPREVKLIGVKLKQWVEEDQPIELVGQKDGYYWYQVEDLLVKAIYPAYTEPSKAEPFVLVPFSSGFIVDFGEVPRGTEPIPALPQTLSETFEKGQHLLRNIDIELVSDVNSQITSGKSSRIIGIGEAVHEKEISDIADMILRQRRTLRVLLISGPSSSGKTSFIQRVSTQMQVNGLKPVPLSLDDYFLDREDTPKDSEGGYDFESLEALDVALLQKHIRQLIDGETIQSPCYDFANGCRADHCNSLSLSPSEILVIEGLHALNPSLMANVNRNFVFKVYVSALGGLNIDLLNRIPTTESRLIRRIVRDDRDRGISPEETLEQWPKVRNGEYKNVFPHQEEADVMFNTSVIYELNALRPFAEAALAKIGSDSRFVETKERLLNLLSFFEPMDISKVPFNSILREFVGESIYFFHK